MMAVKEGAAAATITLLSSAEFAEKIGFKAAAAAATITILGSVEGAQKIGANIALSFRIAPTSIPAEAEGGG